jgi:hypothetical protein
MTVMRMLRSMSGRTWRKVKEEGNRHGSPVSGVPFLLILASSSQAADMPAAKNRRGNQAMIGTVVLVSGRPELATGGCSDPYESLVILRQTLV